MTVRASIIKLVNGNRKHKKNSTLVKSVKNRGILKNDKSYKKPLHFAHLRNKIRVSLLFTPVIDLALCISSLCISKEVFVKKQNLQMGLVFHASKTLIKDFHYKRTLDSLEV